MKAFCICEKLLKAIYKREITRGHVHSVFANACNIETDKGLVTLLTRGMEISPMSAVVDAPVNFKKLGVSRNMSVVFSPEAIVFRKGGLHIDTGDSHRWFPGVMTGTEKYPEKDILANLAVMERGMAAFCKWDGIGPVIAMLAREMPELGLAVPAACAEDKIVRFIKFRFLDFIRTVACGDTSGAAAKAVNVIGFGPGLTPSMDDLMGGLMVSLVYLADYYGMEPEKIYEFNRQMIKNAPGKTTRVSLEMLKHSAEGEASGTVRDLMLAILGGSNDERLLDALKRTAGIGETSGSDIVLGIYVGCRIWTNPKFRGEWENESVCGHPKRKLL